jgi:drug/metabolite transporter (DMT)-like permease
MEMPELRNVKRIATTVALAVVGMLVLASAALAQSSSVSGYGGQAGGVEEQVETGGTLPFTGLDIGLLIGGGLLLVAVGAMLRRLARDRTA